MSFVSDTTRNLSSFIENLCIFPDGIFTDRTNHSPFLLRKTYRLGLLTKNEESDGLSYFVRRERKRKCHSDIYTVSFRCVWKPFCSDLTAGKSTQAQMANDLYIIYRSCDDRFDSQLCVLSSCTQTIHI